VIGWRKKYEGVGARAASHQRGDARRRCRIPADWFEHDVGVAETYLLQLLLDQEAMLLITEDGELTENATAQSRASLLEEGPRTGEAMKLLRECLAREWPEARAGAAT
jgi:hypothetical protein